MVTIQVSSQPPAENPASSSDTTVKQLTLPPVYIVKPLYRENLVDELCRKISAAAQAEEDNKFLLHGFGGVGKITVARALYHKLKKQCKQIGWVECRESGTLKDSLLTAIDTGSVNKTDEERFAEIERLLRDATGETVLFLDNVDRNDPLLRELTRYDLTLVVTSRMEQVGGYTPIHISQLTVDKCMALFRVYCARRTLTEEDEPVVRELVKLVSCHTLSVELLAKGLPAGMGLEAYLERLKTEGFGFPGLTFRTGYDEEIANIAGHLRKLFNMAGLDGEQARVMQNLALMADSRTLPFAVRDWLGCEEDTLAALVNTGWLTQTEEGYEVHPIVRQVVLLDEVPPSAVKQFLDFVTYEAYFQDGEDYRVVQFRLGIVEAVLAQVKDRLEESRDTAALYNHLGVVYREQGKYAEAEKYYQKALDIRLELFGSRHPNTADSYNALGVACHDQRKYDQAKTNYENALNIRLEVLGENHQDTASSYDNMGCLHFDMGRYDLAKENFEKALDIRLNVLGENHLDTAGSYNNLGAIYSRQWEYAQAEEYDRKALNIYRTVLGENHPDTATSYNSLGADYEDQGNYDAAAKQFLHAWRIWQRAFGPEHRDTKLAERNLRRAFPHIAHGDEDFETWLSRQQAD
ncbi:MAG: tetratricopeptide repeat protein [Clostridiales bacterium]|nr:tetratricopeptide repeat protein [Clostridiales bacterium]